MERDLTRLAFLPVSDPALDELYQSQNNMHWTAHEIDYSGDRSQFARLDENTQRYTKFILFLFAQLDGIVIENLVENFTRETGRLSKDAANFYAIQQAMEVVHNNTYSLLIKTLIQDPEEQIIGLNSIKHYPSIEKIAMWSFQYMNPETRSLLERVVAFVCIEGIIFSSAFAGIYWLKRKNILPALCKANEFIARDEALHTLFGISLMHHITEKWMLHPRLEENRVHAIIGSAVEVTEDFTRNAMNCHLVGINADEMVAYVKCTADTICKSLGYNPIYRLQNPLDWMAVISLPNKVNFFEGKVSEYSKEGGEEVFEFDLETPF